MIKDRIDCHGISFDRIKVKNIVIGSGCAAFNAADWLYDLGEKDTVIVTDGINNGTSRNAGSDKQTYYKLSLAGDAGDSVEEMAKTLFDGMGVNGDTALCEAACSVKCFMKLANLGVKFPTNRYGEYVGYKTDHDPRSRATSAGPLTSKDMTEALEKSIKAKNITVLDGMMVVKLVNIGGTVKGAIAINTAAENDNYGVTVIECENIVMATGGPAGAYSLVAYPKLHKGMSGIALEAGAKGANLEEWQYGLATTDFEWNVSGTYQQVLPRFVSVDENGCEREFLSGYIAPENVLLYQFRKGYQWPFTSSNIPGSSEVDIAVAEEIKKGRKVYMDFMHNPKEFESVEKLPEEARKYLLSSGATQSLPIERLIFMNPKAYNLYLDHGIDIKKELLAVAVCAQHCNGGMAVDANWETNIKGLYVCGEAAGTFGVHRPGGSALNSTQVGSLRAAEHIAFKKTENKTDSALLLPYAEEIFTKAKASFGKNGNKISDTNALRFDMSRYAAHVRELSEVKRIKEKALLLKENFFEGCGLKDKNGLKDAFRAYDELISISCICSAIECAAEKYGSRGGSMTTENGVKLENKKGENEIIVTEFGDNVKSYGEKVRPLPERDNWFETTWAEYSERTKK